VLEFLRSWRSVWAGLVFVGAVHAAGTATPSAADPVLEARVMLIAAELRCLVCQNETIAASHAELAVDLRTQIREQLQQGRSPQQILDFMAQRYGDFVLYRPPLKAQTVLLWAGPFALLLLGGYALFRRTSRTAPPEALSPAELARAQQLLGAGADGDKSQKGRS
jgi:cytochrome c-type biogenesis protein CcmH